MSLQEQMCKPCGKDTPPLTYEAAKNLQKEIPDWNLEADFLERTFEFRDFKQAIEFVNNIAEIAEDQKHHPDIHISYNKVRLELSTHKIKGLSENDFILASKIDTLASAFIR